MEVRRSGLWAPGLADYDFKMAESNLYKTGGKEKESFRVFFSAKGKFISSS